MKPKQKYRMLTKPFVPRKGDQVRCLCGAEGCPYKKWGTCLRFGREYPDEIWQYRRPIKSKGVKIIAVNDEKKGKV